MQASRAPAIGTGKVLALLKKHGVARGGELSAEALPVFKTEIEALLASGNETELL